MSVIGPQTNGKFYKKPKRLDIKKKNMSKRYSWWTRYPLLSL